MKSEVSEWNLRRKEIAGLFEVKRELALNLSEGVNFHSIIVNVANNDIQIKKMEYCHLGMLCVNKNVRNLLKLKKALRL